MVNWHDPIEQAKETDIFTKLIFTLFGIYCWELLLTSGFEWSLITRRRKFTWPLIFFFLCRYCILWALIGLLISFSLSSPINCQALYTFNSFTGQMAILNASTSLMIRTIALWERKLIVTIPLCILCLAHWAVLWRGMFVIQARWASQSGGCIVTKIDNAFLESTFFFTMGFDAIILALTTTALLRHANSRSGLWNLLFRDGLAYFLVTASCNAVPAILNVLQLNTVMNIIATVPAAAVAAIAACRLVIRLQDFNKTDPYIHSSQIANDARLQLGRNSTRLPKSQRFTGVSRPEIHVTTDHIVMQDLSPITASTAVMPYDIESKGTDNYFNKFEKDDSDVQTNNTAISSQ